MPQHTSNNEGLDDTSEYGEKTRIETDVAHFVTDRIEKTMSVGSSGDVFKPVDFFPEAKGNLDKYTYLFVDTEIHYAELSGYVYKNLWGDENLGPLPTFISIIKSTDGNTFRAIADASDVYVGSNGDIARLDGLHDDQVMGYLVLVPPSLKRDRAQSADNLGTLTNQEIQNIYSYIGGLDAPIKVLDESVRDVSLCKAANVTNGYLRSVMIIDVGRLLTEHELAESSVRGLIGALQAAYEERATFHSNELRGPIVIYSDGRMCYYRDDPQSLKDAKLVVMGDEN